MADYLKQFQSQLSQLDTKFAGNKVLSKFEAQTKLPRSYAIVGVSVLYFALIFINVGGVGEILSNVVGFCIPTYYSMKALNTATSKDDTELLTYWIVFSFLSVIEFWSKAILYWVPFYWFFKTIFLLYIAIPSFGGARLVYVNLIKPVSDRYLPILDSKTEDLAEKVEHAANNAKASGFSR